LSTAKYLLDTNHASRIMDGRDPVLTERLRKVDVETLVVCPIVSGELVFMVEQSARRDVNAASLARLLGLLASFDITAGVASEYGVLKAALIAKFGPRDRRRRAAWALRDIGVSDNDLWLASVARHFELTIVSSDGDFDRIAEVADLERESWLSAEDQVPAEDRV